MTNKEAEELMALIDKFMVEANQRLSTAQKEAIKQILEMLNVSIPSRDVINFTSLFYSPKRKLSPA